MNKNKLYIIVFLLLSLNIGNQAKAFLPPQFFVQGLSSLWMVLAGGVAVAIVPFLMFYKFIKHYFKTYKKVIILVLIQNVVLAMVIGLIFYYKFYKPLYEDSYLFPQGHSAKVEQELSVQSEIELDLKELNPNYIVENGYLRDLHNNKNMPQDSRYALSVESIEKKIKNKDNLFFIDIREIEEYQAGHVKGSKHLRGMDLTVKKIKELFKFDEEEFKNSKIVLLCHDGGRGLIRASILNQPNIKYVIGGIEAFEHYQSDLITISGPVRADYKIFDKKYQYKYQRKAAPIIEKIKQGADLVLIDGRHKRFFDRGHVKGSIQLNMGRMTTPEYEAALQKVLAKKGSEIVVLCRRFGELFHANLLFLRLQRDYGFDDSKFHIVFNQFRIFKESPHIIFEKTTSNELDIRQLNVDYVVQKSGLLDDRVRNKDVADKNYGLTAEQLELKINAGKKVYFIDVREIEEYNIGHIEGAKHYRAADLTIEGIKSRFILSDQEFSESLFVLVCHDGGRGFFKARRFNQGNIKYLIEGIEYSELAKNGIKVTGPVVPDYEIFSKKYQTKYQMLAKDAVQLMKRNKGILVIDDRHINVYRRKHIKGSVHMKIGHLKKDDYENSLQKILDKKGSKLIVLADRYSELFYANLLLLRLERDYNFDDSKFHIVFNQFSEFEKDPQIKFEGLNVE
jgi:rhodanese-related sulfurtransferase